MNLDAYLKEKNLSLGAFAKQADLSKATVFRMLHRVVIPSRSTMERIEAATDGAVTRFDLISIKSAASSTSEEDTS